MIEATHNKTAEYIFKKYVYRLFKKHFSSLHVVGKIPEIEANMPVIILPNHNTWWDGFFIFFLNQQLFKRKVYLMMLEDQLKHYSFFQRLGAYGINPGDPDDVRKAIRYTSRILNESNPEEILVCIFPQGELLSWYRQPITYKRGIEVIMRRATQAITLLPLTIRIEYIEEQYPQVFFMFGAGEVILPGSMPEVNLFSQKSERLKENLTRELAANHTGLALFNGRRSVHKRYTAVSTFLHRRDKGQT